MHKGSKIPYVLYMVVDRDNDDLPLCVGNIHEISDYTGKSINAIRSAICHAEHRGTNSQYIRIGYEDEEEVMRIKKTMSENKLKIDMLYRDGLTYREIAERLGLSQSTVYKEIHKKRSKKNVVI